MRECSCVCVRSICVFAPTCEQKCETCPSLRPRHTQAVNGYELLCKSQGETAYSYESKHHIHLGKLTFGNILNSIRTGRRGKKISFVLFVLRQESAEREREGNLKPDATAFDIHFIYFVVLYYFTAAACCEKMSDVFFSAILK